MKATQQERSGASFKPMHISSRPFATFGFWRMGPVSDIQGRRGSILDEAHLNKNYVQYY